MIMILKPHQHLYLDVNNLYGWAMSEYWLLLIIDYYCWLLLTIINFYWWLLLIIIDYYWLLLFMIIEKQCDKINFSSNINEVIRPVLNFFFYDKISQVPKSTEKH